MKKLSTIDDLICNIKDLKIQSATTIVQTSLKFLRLEIEKGRIQSETELKESLLLIASARPTEPFLFNCLNYIYWQFSKNKNKKFKDNIFYFDLLLGRLKLIKEEIIKNGVTLIKDGDNIFTHCHSTNVEEIFLEAKNRGIDFKVFLTETRPRYQGRKTAENLVKRGLKVVMMVDSAGAFVISKEDNIKINSIFFGCDAILKDGACFNKIGSFGFALSAKSAKIPLYIVGSGLKYSPKTLFIEQRSEEEVWQERPESLQVINPAFDKIPAGLITKYITEFGQVPVRDIGKKIEENYPFMLTKNVFTPGEILSGDDKIPLPFIKLQKKADKNNNIIATFRLVPEENMRKAANDVAAESSIGTWTEVKTGTTAIFNKLAARVYQIDKESLTVKIAYPLELFEPGNIAQLLSSVAGNIFGMKEVKSLSLLDLDFPEKYVLSYPGPQIGAEEIFKKTAIDNRPLIGCIIKPKLGLSTGKHMEVAMQVFGQGVDLVKDDENLTDQAFNPFFKRVSCISQQMKKKGYWKNEGQKIYSFNITGPAQEMLKRAQYIKTKGGNCMMIDILTSGFSGLQFMRNKNLGLIIHGHRAMHAAMTRNRFQGISMLVIAKLSRLAGVDQLHTGTVIGKMKGGKDEVLAINNFLLSDFYGLKKTLPIASGGLHPGLVPDLIKILGQYIILNFGGGIHGHPQGSISGVKAVFQALESYNKKINIKKFAKGHKELKIALDLWG